MLLATTVSLASAPAELLALVASGAPLGSSPNTLLTVILSVLGGSGVAFLGQLIFRRQQRDSLIASASEQVASAATGMLEEYRKELTKSQAEMAILRERIAALEAQLTIAQADVRRIESERQKALQELARTQQHITELERKLTALEGSAAKWAGRRRTD